MRLRASRRHEARRGGSMMLDQAHRVMPVFFQKAGRPDRGGAYSNYLVETRTTTENLIAEIIKTNRPVGSETKNRPEPVNLYDYHPATRAVTTTPNRVGRPPSVKPPAPEAPVRRRRGRPPKNPVNQ